MGTPSNFFIMDLIKTGISEIETFYFLFFLNLLRSNTLPLYHHYLIMHFNALVGHKNSWLQTGCLQAARRLHEGCMKAGIRLFVDHLRLIQSQTVCLQAAWRPLAVCKQTIWDWIGLKWPTSRLHEGCLQAAGRLNRSELISNDLKLGAIQSARSLQADWIELFLDHFRPIQFQTGCA